MKEYFIEASISTVGPKKIKKKKTTDDVVTVNVKCLSRKEYKN